MDNVEKIYNEGKLLIRAMDQPNLVKKTNGSYYDTQTWSNEFYALISEGMYSLSTTLIVPGVGVSTYKNIGFLINSDLADCFHIAKSDSGSSGNYQSGDFKANKPDFTTVKELAKYIKDNNSKTMNEVNVNCKIDAVVGLFINKCTMSNYLLQKVYVAKKMIEYLTGFDYPIYIYDYNIGKIELLDLNKEKEQQIIDNLASDRILCWPDDIEESRYINIEARTNTK